MIPTQRNGEQRVWLAGIGPAPEGQTVRDDQQRVWVLGADGRYHDAATNRHHETPAGLHARTDLVLAEVAR